jgi:hypothetical protein
MFSGCSLHVNHSVRLFSSPYKDIMPSDRVTKINCCFFAGTDFWQESYIFCITVHHVRPEFKTYYFFVRCYMLLKFHSLRPESKPFWRISHAAVWYIPLAASLTVDCLVTWQVRLPNTTICEHGCTSSAWTLPVTETTFVIQCFHSTDLFRGWRNLCTLYSEFLLDSHHRLLLSKTPAHWTLVLVKSPSWRLYYILVARWNYFLGTRVEHTFLFAHYNGVRLIFVCPSVLIN